MKSCVALCPRECYWVPGGPIAHDVRVRGRRHSCGVLLRGSALHLLRLKVPDLVQRKGQMNGSRKSATFYNNVSPEESDHESSTLTDYYLCNPLYSFISSLFTC